MKRLISVLILLLFCSGCIGFFFGPGFSSTDQNYFAAPPVVVKQEERMVLRWRYGSMGFYFYPRYEVREGALWFSLQATSSTGRVTGREVEMVIEGEKEIAALKRGGAIWWASDGSRVPLTIKEEPHQAPATAPGGHDQDHRQKKMKSDRTSDFQLGTNGTPAS